MMLLSCGCLHKCIATVLTAAWTAAVIAWTDCIYCYRQCHGKPAGKAHWRSDGAESAYLVSTDCTVYATVHTVCIVCLVCTVCIVCAVCVACTVCIQSVLSVQSVQCAQCAKVCVPQTESEDVNTIVTWVCWPWCWHPWSQYRVTQMVHTVWTIRPVAYTDCMDYTACTEIAQTMQTAWTV